MHGSCRDRRHGRSRVAAQEGDEVYTARARAGNGRIASLAIAGVLAFHAPAAAQVQLVPVASGLTACSSLRARTTEPNASSSSSRRA